MKTLRLKSTEKEDIKKAAEILKNGGLAAIPTETVYGLAANALDPVAVGKIFAAKGRPQDNPLIVHVASLDAIPPLVKKGRPEDAEARREILAGAADDNFRAVGDSARCRYGGSVDRGDPYALTPLCKGNNRAERAASCRPERNASGKPSPTCAEHVLADLDGRIDAVVDGGHCSVGVESTVITLATEPPTLLRPGRSDRRAASRGARRGQYRGSGV